MSGRPALIRQRDAKQIIAAAKNWRGCGDSSPQCAGREVRRRADHALTMPRPRPPYLSHERNRHGNLVWYVRVGGKRIRIRETYGTPEFDTAYQSALERARKRTSRPRTGRGGKSAMAHRPISGHGRLATIIQGHTAAAR
jgi:hypothetical protein